MADAGIGEAMLLSAAMGGGSAAITGGDPLKGALLGALTGGLGAGVGGMMSGTMPGVAEAAGAESVGANFVPPSYSLGAPPPTPGIESSLGDMTGKGLSASGGATGFNPQMAQTAMQQQGSQFALNAPASNYAIGAPSVAPGGISNLSTAVTAPSATPSLFNDPMGYIKAHPFMAGSAALTGATGARLLPHLPGEDPNNPLKKFHYDPNTFMPSRPYAGGGITSLSGGNMVVGNDNPAAQGQSNPSSWEAGSFPVSYMASGGISDLGSYSDGGRMLEGPGDGMSDSIPANIAGKRPARLAQGEFVVPADVVSHLGNGSTDAGAKQLYHMMDKVRQARTGRKSQGREINPGKYMPA